MKIQKRMKAFKYILLMICLFMANHLFAQRTLEEQINVVRAYRPVLADAVKIKAFPNITDVQVSSPQLSYLVPDSKLNDNTNPGSISPQKPAKTGNGFIPVFYGKAGLGNLGGLLGEAYLNGPKNNSYKYGAYFQHNSAKGNTDVQKYDRTKLGGFGEIAISPNAKVNLSAAFTQKGNNLYASLPAPINYNLPLFSDSSQTVQQTFSLFEGEAEIANTRTDNSNIVYGLKLGGYGISDHYDSKETGFQLSGLIGKQFGSFSINLAGNMDLTNLETATGETVKNPIYRFQPYIYLKNDKLTFKGGINLVSISDEQKFTGSDRNMFIFPDVSIEFQLIPEYAAIFGGVNGDVKKNTMKSLSSKNVYMRNFSTASNSREKYTIFGGIKGSFSSSVGFKAQFEYAKVDQQNFIVNLLDNPNDFSTLTAGDDGTRMTVSGEMNIRYSQAFRMNLGFNTYKFETDAQNRAWNTPTFKVYVSPKYRYKDKFYLTADLFYVGERFAYLSSTTSSNTYKTLKAYTDLNFGAGYQINKNFGLFLNANNVLNKEYQHYLYYPTIGFNVLGGVTFSF